MYCIDNKCRPTQWLTQQRILGYSGSHSSDISRILLGAPRRRAEEACHHTREQSDVTRTDDRCLRCVGDAVAPTASMFDGVS